MKNLHQGKKNILGRDAADVVLRPFFDDLIDCVREGKEHFSKEPPALLLPYRKRTKATMLNDAITDAVLRRLDGAKGVQQDEACDSLFFVFGERLALRFKKIHGEAGTSNTRTERQKAIEFHQLSLAGINSLTVATWGYRLNKLWSEIIEMKIFCKWGQEILWTIPVTIGAHITSLPLTQDITHVDGPEVRSAMGTPRVGGDH